MIRRLFTAPRVIVLVATIGIAQLSLAMLIALPEIDAPGARFPVPIGGVYEVAEVRVVGPQLSDPHRRPARRAAGSVGCSTGRRSARP